MYDNARSYVADDVITWLDRFGNQNFLSPGPTYHSYFKVPCNQKETYISYFRPKCINLKSTVYPLSDLFSLYRGLCIVLQVFFEVVLSTEIVSKLVTEKLVCKILITCLVILYVQ